MDQTKISPPEEVLPYWLDISSPTPELLQMLSGRFNLHRTSIKDCMDPEQTPKLEVIDNTLFMITRCYDGLAPKGACELLELTRKVAFFCKKDMLITIHRGEQPFIQELKKRLKEEPDPNFGPFEIMVKLIKNSIESFNPYLENLEKSIDAFELNLLERKVSKKELIELYKVRSRLNVTKRLMWHELQSVKDLMSNHEKGPWLTDLKETAEDQYYYVDKLVEDVQQIFNLHLALSDHNANDIMRFLTVISLFFMPLTFIVGVYGMNFEIMPELGLPYGYPSVWVVMLIICAFIYRKVKKKGWLERD